MNSNWQFFYDNAGWGYRPGKESEVMARAVSAVTLARAEAWARENGVRFAWDDDPEGAQVQREDGTWETLPAVTCVAYMEHCSRCDNRETLASLGGITESDNRRDRMNYRRVVQAELAWEAMGRAE